MSLPLRQARTPGAATHLMLNSPTIPGHRPGQLPTTALRGTHIAGAVDVGVRDSSADVARSPLTAP